MMPRPANEFALSRPLPLVVRRRSASLSSGPVSGPHPLSDSATSAASVSDLRLITGVEALSRRVVAGIAKAVAQALACVLSVPTLLPCLASLIQQEAGEYEAGRHHEQGAPLKRRGCAECQTL